MNFKAYLKGLSRQRYLNRLPKKRMGAGCLLFDERGKLLILKPTYKNHWLLPGGVVEANESPRQACIREVKEETGINCQSTKLLCVDYVSDRQTNLESVQFVFSGGTVNDFTAIDIPQQEISAYQFCELEKAILMLGIHSQRRLQSCVSYLNTQQTVVYLENGQQI